MFALASPCNSSWPRWLAVSPAMRRAIPPRSRRAASRSNFWRPSGGPRMRSASASAARERPQRRGAPRCARVRRARRARQRVRRRKALPAVGSPLSRAQRSGWATKSTASPGICPKGPSFQSALPSPLALVRATTKFDERRHGPSWREQSLWTSNDTQRARIAAGTCGGIADRCGCWRRLALISATSARGGARDGHDVTRVEYIRT